jgi:hypothetical protein
MAQKASDGIAAIGPRSIGQTVNSKDKKILAEHQKIIGGMIRGGGIKD